MGLETVSAFKSIGGQDIQSVEVPQFVVLTGENGAGKSHLLQAIARGAVTWDGMRAGEGGTGATAKLFGLGEFLFADHPSANPDAYKAPWVDVLAHLDNLRRNRSTAYASYGDEAFAAMAVDSAVDTRMLTRWAVIRLEHETGKRMIEMQAQDFNDYGPALAGIRDPFVMSVRELFLAYQARRFANDLALFTRERFGRGSPIEAEDFSRRFGPPPWELLTTALHALDLEYRFVPPPDDPDATRSFIVELQNNDGVRIAPEHLSSGERTLLAIAMTFYSGTSLNEVAELPHFLLLDEADASLHPSMIRGLLRILFETYVGQFNLRVMLTTHSPTTAALAPEGSVFVMTRESPRLTQTSTDRAIAALTAGVPTLAVRIANTRQAFVESEVDEEAHRSLFAALKGRLETELSIDFVSVGKRDKGGGAEAVIRLTEELRGRGLTTVHGIVDKDRGRQAFDGMHFVADRYAIENVVYDPAPLCALLLREQLVTNAELGLVLGRRYFELEPGELQTAVDRLTDLVGIAKGGLVDSTYIGGFSLNINANFLQINGHQLETLVLRRFPQFKRFPGRMVTEVARRVATDTPDLLPQSLLDLYRSVLD